MICDTGHMTCDTWWVVNILALMVWERQCFEDSSTNDDLVIEFGPELNGQGPTMHMMIREPSGNRIEFAYKP